MMILERAGIKLTLGALVIDKDVKFTNKPEEIKLLLQKGAYHFFLEDEKSAEDKDKELLNTNIEDLIGKARVLQYTSSQLQEGENETTESKKIESVYFSSEGNAERVDWDDDKFWEKVIPEGLDDPETLYDYLSHPRKELKTEEQKDTFFHKLKLCFDSLDERTKQKSSTSLDYQQSLWKLVYKIIHSSGSLFTSEQISIAQKYLEDLESKRIRKKGKKITHRNSQISLSNSVDSDESEEFDVLAAENQIDDDDDIPSSPDFDVPRTKSTSSNKETGFKFQSKSQSKPVVLQKLSSNQINVGPSITGDDISSIPKTKILLKKIPGFRTNPNPEKEMFSIYEQFYQTKIQKLSNPTFQHQQHQQHQQKQNPNLVFQNLNSLTEQFPLTKFLQSDNVSLPPLQPTTPSLYHMVSSFNQQKQIPLPMKQTNTPLPPTTSNFKPISLILNDQQDNVINPYFSAGNKQQQQKQQKEQLENQSPINLKPISLVQEKQEESKQSINSSDKDMDEIEKKQLEVIEKLKLKRAMKLNK